jgi:hypothetical protein
LVNSTPARLGLMWNYAVARAFGSRRLHPNAPTTQSAPPREPGFPIEGRVAITSQPSIQERYQFLSDNGDRLTPAFSEGGLIFLD